MNTCDFDHDTTEEIRRLPYSIDGGNILVCRRHYEHEMKFRRDRHRDGVPQDFPTWESLDVYSEGI